MPKPLLSASAALLLTACLSTAPAPHRAPGSAGPLAPPAAGDAAARIAETYLSEAVPDEELDSLATWTAEDGRTWLIASAKSGHRLVVFDADSGERLRTVGGRGAALGQFRRPNGVATFGDLLFVVERDAPRVQVLRLPEFAPIGSFGEAELRSPYGLWLHETAPDELEVFVTDSFMDGARFDVVPPLAQLDRRVRRYRLRLHDDRFEADAQGAFGDTSEAGALRIVESIAGDPLHDRLLIADEHRKTGSTLREYTFAGRATGRQLPADTFGYEAEGVALWTCSDAGGYWIAVDQRSPLTVFHVFDRADLGQRGSFSGGSTAQTDGIALHAAATARFPAGALFAVHQDRAVVAFDLRDVVAALRLDSDCVR